MSCNESTSNSVFHTTNCMCVKYLFTSHTLHISATHVLKLNDRATPLER